jgi:membrane protease YdiL (CAAX protease family)
MYAGRLGRRVRTSLVVRLDPGADTASALATTVTFSFIYFFGARTDSALASFLVFTVLGTGITCVLLPAFYVLVVRGEGLGALGITARRWRLALAISAFLAAGSFPGLLRAAHPGVDLAPHLLVNALALWEPFFVFGWLQLRFERAFGVLPGVVLAALCFGAYHLGTFPPPAVLSLVGFGLLYAALFRAIGSNLLVLWPLVWPVGGGIGTLQGGFAFGWASVPGAVVLLLAQAAAIMVFARRSPLRTR